MANPTLQTGWTYYMSKLPNSTNYRLTGISADKTQSSYQDCLDSEYKSVIGSTQIKVVNQVQSLRGPHNNAY